MEIDASHNISSTLPVLKTLPNHDIIVNSLLYLTPEYIQLIIIIILYCNDNTMKYSEVVVWVSSILMRAAQEVLFSRQDMTRAVI